MCLLNSLFVWKCWSSGMKLVSLHCQREQHKPYRDSCGMTWVARLREKPPTLSCLFYVPCLFEVTFSNFFVFIYLLYILLIIIKNVKKCNTVRYMLCVAYKNLPKYLSQQLVPVYGCHDALTHAFLQVNKCSIPLEGNFERNYFQ